MVPIWQFTRIEIKTVNVSSTPLCPLLQCIVYIFATLMALLLNASQISLKVLKMLVMLTQKQILVNSSNIWHDS